jgi:C-terminal processing protease CtpA/Prc
MVSLRLLAAALLAPLLLGADEPPAPDYAADARSIERLVNEDYAYLDRFEGGRMPMSDKLRAEAGEVDSQEELVRYAERALSVLADHHAITGSSLADSWALVPSYSDLWIEPDFTISSVREGSPAERAGVRAGDRLVAVGAVPIAQAVELFWADLGLPVTAERAGYAARVLAAGRRNAPRHLAIARGGETRSLELSNLYAAQPADRDPVTVLFQSSGLERSREGRKFANVVRFNDSLGNQDTIAAFDAAMANLPAGENLILDLTDTASGGNTSVARAIMSWFVDKPTSYQIHTLPAEERQTGVARQWIEQVLPRPGKHHDGPVTVRVGRWTGSMGEGLALGFDAIGARVEGEPMAGLLGAVYDYKLEQSGMVIKFPVERLFHVDGTPREKFVPRR